MGVIVNPEQRKYLKEKVRKAERQKLDVIFKVQTLPKPVAAAKRVVDAWAAKQRKIAWARKARLNEGYSKAIEAMLSGDFPVALKAMKEFERFQP